MGTRDYENRCIIPGCGEPCWREVCRGCGRKIRNGTLPEMGGVKANPQCAVEGCVIPAATTKVTYCRGHIEYARANNGDTTGMRTKRQNSAPPTPCSEPGCDLPSRSKGRCDAHYRQMTYTPRTKQCPTDGCEARINMALTHCAVHLRQEARYGFSWTGPRPTERIAAAREESRPVCKVNGCQSRVSSDTGSLCRKHLTDRSRKHCSLEFYLELKSHQECQACGRSNDRLVVDHDHSCPHTRDEMCESCIRGVLCSGCNTALGLLGESLGVIKSLGLYIERFQQNL